MTDIFNDQAPVVGKVPYLNDMLHPAQGKAWGCLGCPLYQYSPLFKKSTIEQYDARLDDERWNYKNCSHKMNAPMPDGAEVMAVFDFPTNDEDESGSAFQVARYKSIRDALKKVDINPDSWYWCYRVRCAPRKDGKVSRASSIYCTRYLAEDVVRMKPKVIVTFGQDAMTSVLGKADAFIQHFVGRPQEAIVSGHPCIVYPMQSPTYVGFRDYLWKSYMQQFEDLSNFLNGNQKVEQDTSNKSIIEDPDEAIALCQRFIETAVARGDVIEMDLETSGLNPYQLKSRISVVSLARSTQRGYAIMVNHDECPWSDDDRLRFVHEGLRPLMTHPEVKLRWHNGKFDVKWIRQHFKFWPRDQIEDTMLSHYAAEENIQHGLKELAVMLTDMGDYDAELAQVLRVQGLPDSPRYDLVEKGLLGKYAAMDAVATRKLADAVAGMLAPQGKLVKALAYRAMPAFSATLTRMEHNGVAIDTDFTGKNVIPFLKDAAAKSYADILAQPLVRKFRREMEEEARQKYVDGLKGRLDKKTGVRVKKTIADLPSVDHKQYFSFSLGSSDQLKTLFYDARYYGHPVTKVTPSGEPSTDKEVLTDLAAAGSPIAAAIQEYRLDDKMVNTYGDPIIERCASQGDNLLHGSFLLHGTKTGRLSSREPNLQNQPNKSGGLIKRMFVSRYGADGVFLQVDFSQIELRVLAAAANDPNMIEAYRTGKDLHLMTACLIFGLTEEQFRALPDKEKKFKRTVAKRVNFGIAYGIGGQGIMHTLKSDGVIVDKETARGYLDTFYEKYPCVMEWIESIEQFTADNVHSLSLFGRRRRLLEITSAHDDLSARARRQGVNHVIQSTAGDMTMTALCLYDQEVCIRSGRRPDLILPTIDPIELPRDDRWKRVHPMLQVHDMIGVDCHKDVAAEATDRLIDIMENVVDYAPRVWGDVVIEGLKPLKRVPIVAEAEVGPNWRDAYKVKTGADVPKAMYVACAKQARLDPNPKSKWTEEDDKAAIAAFAAYEKEHAP